jgi:hypothetical protein
MPKTNKKPPILENGTRRVIPSTPCPFRNRVMHVEVDATSGMYKARQAIARVIKRVESEQKYITIRLTREYENTSLSSLAELLSSLFKSQSNEQCADWTFSPEHLSVAGIPIFCVVVSNIYPRHHPRHCIEGTFLIVQPESLFTKLGVTTNPKRSGITREVERSFRLVGKDYYHHHRKRTPKTARILLDFHGEPYKWW